MSDEIYSATDETRIEHGFFEIIFGWTIEAEWRLSFQCVKDIFSHG